MQALPNGVTVLALAIDEVFPKCPGTSGKCIGNIWQSTGLLKIGTFVQADYPEAQKDAADVTS
jgi:hypothetical protein